MSRTLTEQHLHQENLAFAGTAGVSAHNRRAGLIPAFRDSGTGRVEIARFEDGQPAPMHLICGLPAEWVTARDDNGHVIAVRDSIEPGFIRDDVFYTRQQAADLD